MKFKSQVTGQTMEYLGYSPKTAKVEQKRASDQSYLIVEGQPKVEFELVDSVYPKMFRFNYLDSSGNLSYSEIKTLSDKDLDMGIPSKDYLEDLYFVLGRLPETLAPISVRTCYVLWTARN